MFSDRMPKDMESLVYNAAAEAKLYLVLKIIFLVTLTSRVTKSSSLIRIIANQRQSAGGYGGDFGSVAVAQFYSYAKVRKYEH